MEALLRKDGELDRALRTPTRAWSAGIRPIAVPGFMATHIARAFAATFLFGWLVPSLPEQVGGTAPPPVRIRRFQSPRGKNMTRTCTPVQPGLTRRPFGVAFRGPGTDLRAGLPDDHLWLGGGMTAARVPKIRVSRRVDYRVAVSGL
jgi:hypothetical protein